MFLKCGRDHALFPLLAQLTNQKVIVPDNLKFYFRIQATNYKSIIEHVGFSIQPFCHVCGPAAHITPQAEARSEFFRNQHAFPAAVDKE